MDVVSCENMYHVFIVFSGLACGVYATNNSEACKYIAEDCKVSIAVVEDQKQLDKFLKVCIIILYICTIVIAVHVCIYVCMYMSLCVCMFFYMYMYPHAYSECAVPLYFLTSGVNQPSCDNRLYMYMYM